MDCIETVRQLKSWEVGVFFEKENRPVEVSLDHTLTGLFVIIWHGILECVK